MDERWGEDFRASSDATLFSISTQTGERGAAARAILEERRMRPLVEASQRAADAAEGATKTATWAMWAAVGSCVAAAIAAIAAVGQLVH